MPRIQNTICTCSHDRFDHLKDSGACTKCDCQKFADTGTKRKKARAGRTPCSQRDGLAPARAAMYEEIARAVDRYLASVGVHLKSSMPDGKKKPGRKQSYSSVEEIQAILPKTTHVKEWQGHPDRDGERRESNGEIKLGKAHKLILSELKAAPNFTLSKATLAARCCYGVDGGHFNNVLGELRGELLIVGSDPIAATAASVKLVADLPPPLSGHALLEQWKRHKRVGKCGKEILDVLWRFKNDELTKEEIARYTASGYEADGGHFNNELGALKTLGAIVIAAKAIGQKEPRFRLAKGIWP